MNDRREFLDRLRTDLAAGVPGFRGRQRRRRIVASAVAALALLGGLGAFVALSGDEEPSESVNAVGNAPQAPAYEQTRTRMSISVSTGTVRDLTDTVGDIEDLTLEVGTPLGGPLDLVAAGRAVGGAIQACPPGASSQGTIQVQTGFLVGEREEITQADEEAVLAVVRTRITLSPLGAPASSSELYIAQVPDGPRTMRTVLAPWPGEEENIVGASFGVTKTSAGMAIESSWACTAFMLGEQEIVQIAPIQGTTPWGAPIACPSGAEEGFVTDLVGSPQLIGAEDFADVTAFVQAYIEAEYPPDAAISGSRIFVVPSPRPPEPAPLFVAAPWPPNDDEPIGMWFRVGKTDAGFAVTSGDGCQDFVTSSGATTLSSSEVDELLAGLRDGLIDYSVAQTPAELADFIDTSVRGTVVAVHEGRTFRSLLETSGLNDESFATLEIEGDEFASADGTRRDSSFYIEIQMGDLGVDELQVLVGTEVIAFGIDTSDVDLGEQWAIDNPLGGRPNSEQPIFAVHPQGLLLVTDQSLVSVYDDLALGWTPAQDFATGTEAADWVVAEATK